MNAYSASKAEKRFLIFQNERNILSINKTATILLRNSEEPLAGIVLFKVLRWMRFSLSEQITRMRKRYVPEACWALPDKEGRPWSGGGLSRPLLVFSGRPPTRCAAKGDATPVPAGLPDLQQ
jgi:hypothetical protein